MSTATEILAKIKQRGLNKAREEGESFEKSMRHELEISLHHTLVRLGQMAIGEGFISAVAKITLDEIEKGVS